MFFSKKVKNFRRLSRKISRWDKDESSRLTRLTVTTGHRSHPNHPFFFLCGCCMLLCSGDWPLAQNLWRFESAALNTILDVAEVKAGERENKRANFTSNLMFIILTSTCTKETVHRSGCTVHAMICNDIQYTLWSVPSGLSL